jgi:hypothetical protein
MRGVLATLVAAAVIAESWPALTLADAATPIQALQRSDLVGPVIELPLGESWLDAPAQFRGIVHGRPVVNGYSGYAPPHYHLLSTALRLNDGDGRRSSGGAASLTAARPSASPRKANSRSTACPSTLDRAHARAIRLCRSSRSTRARI